MAGIKLELTDLPEFTDSLEITIVVKKDGTIIQRVVPNPPSPQQPSYVPPRIPSTPPISPGYIGDPPPGTIPNITCNIPKGAVPGSNRNVAVPPIGPTDQLDSKPASVEGVVPTMMGNF
jgi:hypothetical protein